MNDQWVNDFVQSFQAPKPSFDLLSKVKMNMHSLILEEQKKRSQKSFILWITFITIATIPIFFLCNYMYLLVLQKVLSIVLPGIIVKTFLLFFLSTAFFIGAFCYGTIPLFIANILKHGNISESPLRTGE